MSTVIGADTTATPSSLTDGKGFAVGDRHTDYAGNDWVYVKASEAIAQYDFVAIDEDYAATQLTGTEAAAGYQIGVAAVAFASADYGWVQTKGIGTGAVAVSCAADITLHTSATAGALDDATSVGTNILGVVCTAAQAGTSASLNTTIMIATQMHPITF